ncbi:MAG: hypothetical protein JW982_10505 [Spirochaetes bacterium]|nr:hypothetical protein [Spirochaetota bacterium]
MNLKEYNYSNPRHRLLTGLNAYLTSAFTGLLLANTIFFAKQVLFYENTVLSCTLAVLSVLLAGNLTGKFLFSWIKKSRAVYISTEILFVISISSFIFRGLIFKNEDLDIVLTSINTGSPFIFILAALPVFLAGIKINYFLKISSGLFIDEKQGAFQFIFFLISGLLTGAGLYVLCYKFKFNYFAFAAFPAAFIPFLFLINEKYNPQNFIANTVTDENQDDNNEKREYRDDIFFTYLNFSCIIIYFFLGNLTVLKFIGSSLETGLLFIFVTALSFLAGYVFSAFIKKAYWHIYSGTFYPFIFLSFFLVLFNLNAVPQKHLLVLFFIPMGFISGLTVFHSLKSILNRFNHHNSYTVINISFFILPIPILFSLMQITFTYRWFFIIFYSLAFLNILFPGIHLTQRPVKEYKKGIYFIVLLITIPLFIFSHAYFKIAPDNSLLISHSGNFDSIYNINYNSDYISDTFTISVDDRPAARISDNFYRDLKQSFAAIELFLDGDKSKILFLDGYRKFLFNTGYKNFKNSILLDYVPSKITDYRNLPISGEKEVITVSRNMYSYFYSDRKTSFDSVVLIPNLIDQTENSVLFSDGFLKLVKSKTAAEGFTALILDINEINSQYLKSVLYFMKTGFKKTVILNFSSQLVIISSDNENAFQIDDRKLNKCGNVIAGTDFLFYDSIDFLSHMTNAGFENVKFTASIVPHGNRIYYPDDFKIETDLNADNLKIRDIPLTEFFKLSAGPDTTGILKKLSAENSFIYTALFNASYYNSRGKYSDELTSYTGLLKPAEKNPALKKYIEYVLQIKKLNYSALAEMSEKNKEWDKAKELYNAILAIEPDNFNAIYNLSIISITIQDLDKAFEYLTRALELNKSNTDVMYHMGVLLFAKQDYKKSQYYLNMAVSNNRADAMTFFYLGMTYEQMGEYSNFLNARKNYKIALAKNPNNDDINAAFFRIEDIIKNIESGWTSPDRNEKKNGDSGEQVPLPVTEKALNSRLSDE